MDLPQPKPKKVAKPVKFSTDAALLRANPGRWGLLTDKDRDDKPSMNVLYAMAYNIKKGKTKAFAPEGDFEAKAVEGHGLFVRYVGNGTQTEPTPHVDQQTGEPLP